MGAGDPGDIASAGVGSEVLLRVIAWLIGRFGEAVLEWSVRELVARLTPGQVGGPVSIEEPYFWDDPTAYCEDDDPCR